VASSLVPDAIFREVDDLDRIIRLPWVSWNDYPVIAQVDIGCCSVEDTEFSRAKTPIKCWEGAIAGAAMIGTEVLYGPCLAYGGLTANTDAEWEDALAYLIERPDTRGVMNAALVQHVERHHSIDNQLHRWPAALAQIVAASVAVPA
jgi:hypothetical protein